MKTVGPERPKAWIIEKLVLKLKNRFGTLLGRVRVPMETPTGFASARQDVLICSIYVHRVPQRTDNLLGKQGCALRARSRRPDAISPHLDSPRLETHSVRSDAAPDECRGCAPTTPQPRPPPQANCYRVAFGSTRACPLPYRGCRPVISVHRELRPRWPTRLRQMEKTVPLRQWIGPQEI